MAEKKILLLGAGYVAGPFLNYMLRRPENNITVACRTEAKAVELAGGRPRTSAISLDVKDSAALDAAVAKHDIVISLIPYTYHPLVIESAIKNKKNFCSTSYVSQVMAGFDQRAKDAGLTIMNEIGVDPGIDHLYAMKTINEVHEAGGKIKSFLSYCGGLPAPEASNNPLGYKLSWSARGVLLAAGNDAKFLENGEVVHIPGKDLLSKGPREINIYPAFAFEGYPNRDSTPYSERYGIPEAHTILRGTLRYKGNPSFIKALADIGFLNDDAQDWLQKDSPDISWLGLSAKLLGVDATKDAVIAKAVEKAGLEGSPNKTRIVSGLKWLGLVSDSLVTRSNSILDTLAAALSTKMEYKEGERDMIMLQHRFEIEKADGSPEVRTSTMVEYGVPNGDTAMSTTVGVPCAIATQLILDGVITRKGVLAPLEKDVYEPIIAALEKEGLSCKEEILEY